MTRAEVDDLKRRALNYLRGQMQIKGATYIFTRINPAIGMKETGQRNLNYTITGTLESPAGRIITRSLRTIVHYFEALEG